MFDFIWNLSSFIVALGILITVHEYGHYWVARKNGVKVERFSVGFGQPIWRKTDKHGTEFVVALIPLGGYVKMLDERVDNVSLEDKDKTFNSKSVYQRIAIIGAGPFANFAFAILAFYLMFLIGVPSIKPVVGDIIVDSIAAKAKLPSNVEIVQVGQHKTLDWQDVNQALVSRIGNETLVIKTKGLDSQYITTTTLQTKNWTFSPDKESAFASLGIMPFRPAVHTILSHVAKGSAAEEAGLKIGDELVSLNGKLINDDWRTFSEEIKTYPNQEVNVSIKRAGKIENLVVIPKSTERNGKNLGYLGVAPQIDEWPSQYKINLQHGPIDAIGQSINKTWDLVVFSFDMIGKLFTGDVSVKNLSGPISIAQGAGNSAGHGLVYFLSFLALISINLGIINLLPLPVLDGGHLLYYFVELVTGKPVPEKFQEIGFRFGTIALLSLMGIALFNDFSRVLGSN